MGDGAEDAWRYQELDDEEEDNDPANDSWVDDFDNC